MKAETEQKTRKTIIYRIMIIIIMRGENFVAHLDGVGGTPVAHHWSRERILILIRLGTTFTLSYRLAGRIIINCGNLLKLRGKLLQMFVTYYRK
jgi:hypothetical protein